jgi:molecular chaperone DnaJ
MSADYYNTLGVSKDSSQDDIKKAFRKKAMEFHPDRNQGNKDAEKKFKEVNEAYETLKDDQKRAAYDRYGHDGFKNAQNGGFNPGAAGSQGFSGAEFRDFSDVFGNMFEDLMGGARRPQYDNTKGSDLRYNLNITLEDAYHGKQQQIKYHTGVQCDDCHGKGSKDKDSHMNCLNCGGTGRSRMQQGFFMVEKTCGACNGAGKVIKNPCRTCGGQGRVEKQRSINVTIPPGIEEGSKIRVAGAGEAGVMGGKTGDLYIFVHIKKHNLYARENNDLICEVPIKMTAAALGGSIEIPGLDGHMIKITIPAGTQSSSVLRLRSKGMPILRKNSHGDLLVEENIVIPTQLTKKQKELLEEFDNECSQQNHPQSEGFFSKVKNFWSDITK